MQRLLRAACIAALCAGGLATPVAAGPYLSPNGPMIFDSVWGNSGAPQAGETPILFDPDAQLRPDRADGLALVGSYPFAEGRLYGCYDEDARVLRGLWTQGAAAPDCAQKVGRQDVWGRFEFRFSEDGQAFEGFWTSCDREASFLWDGGLQPTPIQEPDSRQPLLMLDRMPSCEAPVS